MKFGEVPLAEAEGAILAHSLPLPAGRLRKGARLTADDLARLGAAGHATVVVARLQDGDVAENDAAERLARSLAGPGLKVGQAFTGRCNLTAKADGVALIEPAAVVALNRVDESLTVATVPPFEPVEAGQIIATVKVIPYAVPAAALARAIDLAAGGGAIGLAPFRPATAGLAMTELAGQRKSLAAKTEEVTRARLARFGARLGPVRIAAHETGAVASALADLAAAKADPIIVFSASAVADRADVVPAGLVAAGGRIVHFGMPVDPGNLLLVGRLGEATVLAAPGSARSPRSHGFDLALARVLAGLALGPEEIAAMAVGGLLREIPSRPQPRAGEPARRAARPRVAAVVLAAGRSQRMGAANKLLLEVAGRPMVARAVAAARASGAAETVVVTGHMAAEVEAALAGAAVRFVRNPQYAEGLSTSLAAGIGALGADIDAAVVLLGDMPQIAAGHIDALIAAFDPAGTGAICVATFQGKRGNPVLWARRFFGELTGLRGDVGARHLIGEHAELVAEVALDGAVHTDVDTPEAYAALAGPIGG